MEIVNNHIVINGVELKNYIIIRKLGEGANGIVYLVENALLHRKEALKIWSKKRQNDKRDKIKQGLLEASKQAANDGNHSVQIYHINVLNNVVFATMEYIDGITLLEYCESTKSASEIISMAHLYLTILEKITTKKTIHGDPHWKNVLIFEEKPSKYEESRKSIKFCDFGTSYYSKKELSRNRHWKIVRKTIMNMTHKLESYQFAQKHLENFDKLAQKMIDDLDHSNIPNIDDYDESRMRTAVLRDYLDCFTMEVEKEKIYNKSISNSKYEAGV